MNETVPPCRYGRLVFHAGFASGYVQPRNLIVWLPPGYEPGGERRYPVLYAQDGQNLFDPRTSFAGVDWGLAEAMEQLAGEGGVREALIVGIWNSPERYREYDPQQVFTSYLTSGQQAQYARQHGEPLSDRYLRFLVEDLKPFIDRTYRTRPGQADTLLLGSSMGGLISAYALCEYPEIFGAAACLSTHWPALFGQTAAYLAQKLPDPGRHRFYFDYGTETIDSQYEPYQLRVDNLMRGAGYVPGTHWLTRKFAGEEHSERAWRRRVTIPLRFLLS